MNRMLHTATPPDMGMYANVVFIGNYCKNMQWMVFDNTDPFSQWEESIEPINTMRHIPAHPDMGRYQHCLYTGGNVRWFCYFQGQCFYHRWYSSNCR